MKISCSVNGRAPSFLHWDFPERLGSGLGSSAAAALSMIRAKYPHTSHRDQIDAAIHLERLQAGVGKTRLPSEMRNATRLWRRYIKDLR
ncbi:MAG: hypothetical protein OXU51_16570 [Candidatus Poribacteria bacterium]|nr:hypothetical protein [Candidatus Poribacteria bacterium]